MVAGGAKEGPLGGWRGSIQERRERSVRAKEEVRETENIGDGEDGMHCYKAFFISVSCFVKFKFFYLAQIFSFPWQEFW